MTKQQVLALLMDVADFKITPSDATKKITDAMDKLKKGECDDEEDED